MQLHQLQPKTKRMTSKRVGRGRASGKGKTSGRGTKGQKARAGHKMWPQIRETLKKLPKRRGYRFTSIQEKPMALNVSTLEKFFSAGDTVSPKVLSERNIVRARQGSLPKVKILGEGALSKKLTITGMSVSASAKEKIEKAGGSIA
jgi:large subunit ribosomal protein L15